MDSTGTRVFVRRGGGVGVYDALSGNPTGEIRQANINAMSIVGSMLYAAFSEPLLNQVLLYDTTTLALLNTITLPPDGSLTGIAVNATGDKIYADSYDGYGSGTLWILSKTSGVPGAEGTPGQPGQAGGPTGGGAGGTGGAGGAGGTNP